MDNVSPSRSVGAQSRVVPQRSERVIALDGQSEPSEISPPPLPSPMAAYSAPPISATGEDPVFSGLGTSPVSKMKTEQIQSLVYQHLLALIQDHSAEDVLAEFRCLFFDQNLDQPSAELSDALQGLYCFGLWDAVAEFRHTLKRSTYILVNNWTNRREGTALGSLLDLFECVGDLPKTQNLVLKRLRRWMVEFCKSEDYGDLRSLILSQNLELGPRLPQDAVPTEGADLPPSSLTRRYPSHFFLARAHNPHCSLDERIAAQRTAEQLRDRFRFNLARFTARSQSGNIGPNAIKNPTGLGDHTLNLIKTIVLRSGQGGYASLARLFLEQTVGLTYGGYKRSLVKYLICAVSEEEFGQKLRTRLTQALEDCYPYHQRDRTTPELHQATCLKLVQWLTTENQHEPSPTFLLLVGQGSALTLTVLLLKIAMICPESRNHMDLCIARLLQYYENLGQSDLKWLNHFMDVFNVAFAIHSKTVRYDLVALPSALDPEESNESTRGGWDGEPDSTPAVENKGDGQGDPASLAPSDDLSRYRVFAYQWDQLLTDCS